MLYLLKCLLILWLISHDDHIILARHTLLKRVSKPSIIASSNISAASSLTQAYSNSSASASKRTVENHSYSMAGATTALPIPFQPNPEYAGDYKNINNYQDIKSGTCAIQDDYCSFQNNNGMLEKANATNLDDRCLLWDSSCSGNRTLAMDRFFNTTFQYELMSNACFAPVDLINSVDSVSVSNCDKYNPPDRMSELRDVRHWMRSTQCVSVAKEWAAMTPGGSNDTFASAEDDDIDSEDPDSRMAAVLSPPLHPYNYSSGVAPSCCGICNINAENVDIYYWPEPGVDTSCLSIIGEGLRPLDYGATTSEFSVYPTEIDTVTYWACNATFSVPGNLTSTTPIKSAQISTIGSLLVKVPIINPWSPSPCLISKAFS